MQKNVFFIFYFFKKREGSGSEPLTNGSGSGRPPISTWCVGEACSMGSLLLTNGTKVPGTSTHSSVRGP
jgi:hypothetical protein